MTNNERDIGDMLGHASGSRVTRSYVHLADPHRRAVAQDVQGIIAKALPKQHPRGAHPA